MLHFSSQLVVVVVCGALLFIQCGKKEADLSKTPVDTASLLLTHVKMATVLNGANAQTITASAIVSSDNEAQPAFKIGGVIKKMYVKEGDMVKAGQLLATLNLTEIGAQLQQAEQGVEKAKRDLQRAKNLYADSVATLETVQNATTGVEIATRNVEILVFNQSYAEVRAPIAGRIMKLLQHEGEIVGPGLPVCFILGTNTSDWRLKAGLSDRDWSQIKLGSMAQVRFDAYPAQIYSAKVSDLAIAANPQTGTFDIEMRLIDKSPTLAAGLIANVVFATNNSENQTLLPIEALVDSDGIEATVFVVENNMARARKVQIKRLLGNQVAIAAGLEGITEVVATGAAFLGDGEKVVVVR